MYEIRDPIHSTITFTEHERKVIDHPFVQRLHYIRQLGMKHLVYPGAVHDRFSHVLGAMHMAGRIFDAIDQKSDVFGRLTSKIRIYLRHILRLSALLHDVGHGPFSHASEILMPELHKLDIPKTWYKDYDGSRRAHHEDYSVLLIRTLSMADEKILAPDEARDIASLVHKRIMPSPSWFHRFKSKSEAEGYNALLGTLISGEIDADRMDYLLRDAYFTGVSYGNYDREWMLARINAVYTDRGPMLVVESGGLRAFEDFLLARYHMFLQVYFHRTTIGFEYYIEQAIRSGEIRIKMPSSAYEYADLRDGGVLEAIYAASKDKKNAWSRRIVFRKPPKFVFRREGENKKSVQRYEKIIAALSKAKIPFFEISAKKRLAEQVALRPGAARILISDRFLDKLEYQPIEKRSELLKKYNEKIDLTYVFVLRENWESACRALRRR